MDQHHNDNWLDPLREALDTTPSPQFGERVRDRLEADRARRSAWRIRSVFAAAAVAATVVIVARWLPEERDAVADAIPVPAARVQAPAVVPAMPLATANAERRAERPAMRRLTQQARRSMSPRVLVSPDTLDALEQLRRNLNDGTLTTGNWPTQLEVVPRIASPAVPADWSLIERPWPTFGEPHADQSAIGS
jgi:hypothetical protein